MESLEEPMLKREKSDVGGSRECGSDEESFLLEKWQAYWSQRVSGEVYSLNLPMDYQPSVIGAIARDQQVFLMGAEFTEQMKQFCHRYEVSLDILSLSVGNVWLHKYSDQEEILVGTPQVGEWIYGILKSDQIFLDFLHEINQQVRVVLNAMNQPEQRKWFREQMKACRQLDAKLMSQVCYLHQQAPTLSSLPLLGQESRKIQDELRPVPEQSDLLIQTYDSGDEIQLTLDYNRHLFAPETIERMGQHYLYLLEQILADPEKRIVDLTLLTEREEEQILLEFNQPIQEPAELTVQQLFADQVASKPDQIAVVMGEEKLTYRQLDQRSNQVAQRLRKLGVGPEQIVGILTQPSLEMLVGILAILKAGGAYLPIDPAYPGERVQYMLADSQAQILLTVSDLWTEQQTEFSGVVLTLDDPVLFMEKSDDLPLVARPQDLAYVIYTSGSTGKPKGVMIENRSLVNLVQWHNQTFQVTDQDRAIKYAGVGFDASVWEIFPYLATGATIYVVPPEMRLDLLGLNEYMEKEGITIGFLPTQFCEQFLKMKNRSLRVLLTGGDKLQEFIPQSYLLVNNYGPTENTVVSTSFVIDQQYRNIPIGQPITNTQVYILSQDDHLQPVGVPGELCVAGQGIARGYLNRLELTREKFVPNPYLPNTQMYRTGDLARWLPDGNVEFLGRIDQQVKIRGFRIELGEIENQLLQLDRVQSAVVVDREDSRGLKELVAYFVADQELPVEWVRKELARELPEYMIPSYLIQLQEIPLTANGKVDRRALPAPTPRTDRQQEWTAPRTAEEVAMAGLWSEVLGLKRVGVTDTFFELGGHSLHATLLVARINKELGVSVQIQDIFAYPTVQKLVTYLSDSEESCYQPIPPVEKRDYYPASSNQRRLFAQDQVEGLNTTYNLPLVWQITGDWDQERLKAALRELVQRHEGMRTYFSIVNGEPVQKIADEVLFEIPRRQIKTGKLEQVIREFIRPFDLSQPPLFRMELVETADGNFLLLDLHHIITDGSSLDIWLKELGQVYAGDLLSPLPIQYKDYSVWQKEQLESDEMGRQEEFWLEIYADQIPVLNLPLDEPRPSILRYEGAGKTWRVGPELTRKIRALSERAGATLYMTLLAIYNVFLQKYSGQEDLIIGAPVAGRSHADLADVFGLFVNLLALRNQPRGDLRFCDFLAQVKANTLAAFAHQDYQFETLVARLGLARDVSRNPLFDVGFIVQNATDLKLVGKDWGLIPYELPVEVAKFDLLLQVYEKEDELQLNLEYSVHLFKPETIERMGGHLLHLLEQMVDEPERRIAELTLMTQREKEEILFEFNSQLREGHTGTTIQQLFARQVEANPDQIAVLMGEDQLTYRQLNQRANQLAHRLRALGVGTDEIVGILVEPSLEMLIGIWAVLKAGGAYLPIDPVYPRERINYMLADSQAQILLTGGELFAGQEVDFAGQVIKLDDPTLYTGVADELTLVAAPEDLVYVIYTSGSTGKPKGVMIENRSLVNLVQWHNQAFQVTAQDRASKYAGVGFDASVWEIFPYLSAGATIYIIPAEMRLDLPKLNDYLEEQQITISFLPTQICEQFMKLENHSLRFLLAGGDKLLEYTPQSYTVVNNYGPTENTVVSTSFVVDGQYRNLPIGRPIANTQVYILGSEDQLQPVGVAGELCVSGVGLARGYLNRPKLTQEKFVPNPDLAGERMYRTGDLARWLPDGNIEFLGRIDHQVKIRGYRIELGEIENQLLRLKGVEEAVVLDREDQYGGKDLIAFIVATEEIFGDTLRQGLAKELPDYMIPTSVTQVPELPLTANGKIDRKLLLSMETHVGDQRNQYVVPRTEVERQMAKIWMNLLQIEQVGVMDHFFRLGGHSLLAIKVVTQALALGWQITVQDIFNYPTVQELAALIEGEFDGQDLEQIRELELVALAQELGASYGEVATSGHTQRLERILLTGVTGFLGAHLLEDILLQTDAEVFCLIRGESEEQIRERLAGLLVAYFGQSFADLAMQRVNLVLGDLTEVELGLTPEEYKELVGKIDTVVHAAALVKHFGDYADFERVNVQGTARVIELALRANARLHHISTISLAGEFAPGEDEIIFTEKDFYVGQEYRKNVYLRSKFEAEKLILQGMKEGLQATIYRVGNLTGRSRDGQFQLNIEENAFYSLLKSLIQLQNISGEMMELPIEFTPIDFCSRGIVEVMQRSDSRGRVLHLQNEKILLGELLPVLAELGLDLEVLAEGDFADLVQELAQDAEQLDLLSGLMHEYQYRGQDRHGQAVIRVDSSWTNQYLAELGFVWPVADREYLRKIFGYMRKVGFI